MQSNRQGFGESRLAERHPGGDGTKVRDRQVDQFTEETGIVRVAQKAYVCAYIVVPAQTELAVIAIKRGLKCPAVARSESSHAVAGLHYRSCGLVPEHHRVDVGSAPDR